MLEILLIIFIVIAVLAIIGILVLYISKDKRVNTASLVFLAILGCLVAYISTAASPTNYILNKTASITWGLLAVAGVFVRFGMKKYPLLAKLLVTASVVIGIVQLFWF